MVAIRRTTKAIAPPSRPPNSGGTSDRTHLGMCHALGTARFLIFMLVGEIDRTRVLLLQLRVTERQPSSRKPGRAATTGKMGLTVRLGGAVGGEDISPGAPRSRPACWSRARATFTAAVMSTQQPAPPPWLRRYLGETRQLCALEQGPSCRRNPWFRQKKSVTWLAGGPGFEPGLLGPEPRVLPLNYPPTATDEA